MSTETQDAWKLYQEVLDAGLAGNIVPYPRNYGCRHDRVEEDHASGNYVCIDCGYVNKIPIYVMSYNDSYVQFRGNCSSGSSYKRTHYFNDKVNQWSCRDANFSAVIWRSQGFLPESGIVTKKTIRNALRLMGRAKDGENWIFIQCQLTNRVPEVPTTSSRT